MDIGSIVFATDQGLGVLAKSFYDNRIVKYVKVLRHTRRVNHTEWYPGAEAIHFTGILNKNVKDFIKSMEVMLFFETPFHWELIKYCKEVDVPCVLMPMHECAPKTLPFRPNWILCPSELEHQLYKRDFRIKCLPVPTDVMWERRERALRYLHNAGNLGIKWRNGTLELMKAMKYVESDLHLTIRSQVSLAPLIAKVPEIRKDKRVEIIDQVTVDKHDLYKGYDVFVFPEKFNGLSLPLQEAHASGMLVMATNRCPNYDYLPREPLIPVKSFQEDSIAPTLNNFSSAIVDPKAIAAKMDEFYNTSISYFSRLGLSYLSQCGWESLRKYYMEFFRQVAHEHSLRS